MIELMVALTLGLVVTLGVGAIYLATKVSFTRQIQVTKMQQAARTAFENLAHDARMVGYRGCRTGATTNFNTNLSANSIRTAYDFGIQGYNFNLNPTSYTMVYPLANVSAANEWNTNIHGPEQTIPVADIGGVVGGANRGMTPGSDVLVIRTVASDPVRLAAAAHPVNRQVTLDSASTRGRCSSGQPKMAGFCVNSHALISSCSQARVFTVTGINANIRTFTADDLGTDTTYVAGTTEVFPVHTVVYYLRLRDNNAPTPSLYRKLFNGDFPDGLDQELVEGVESLQVSYGLDTSAPTDPGFGEIDGGYVTADAVGDWGQVVAVRMSLLLRTADSVGGNLPVRGAGVVNGVTISYPTTGARFDRRVFTTTVAIRNRIRQF